MKYLSIATLTLLICSQAYSGTEADKECIEWMLNQYPELKRITEYRPEHDLLIEKIETPKGPVSIIHTQKGSVASVPHTESMHCRPKRKIFGGREVKGISGFLNLAMYTKVSSLYEEGGDIMKSLRFLQNMPLSCDKTSYPNLTQNIKAVCIDLAKVPMAKSLLKSAVAVCKGSLQ